MTYLILKYLHVLSSTLLFGTGIGTASVMLYAHRTRNVVIIAAITRYVVIADWLFTATSGVMQPLTGLGLMKLAGYSFKLKWIYASLIAYLIAAVCWFIVASLQIDMRNMAQAAQHSNTELPERYFQYFKYWFCLGWPAFISLLLVFYWMVSKQS